MSDEQLFSLLDKLNKTSRRRNLQRARLGDGSGNLTTNRQDFVWARIFTSAGGVTVTQVRCRKHQPQYGAPVLVEKNDIDDTYEVTEEDPLEGVEFWGNFGSGNVAKHAPLHGYYGSDPVIVNPLQLDILRTYPSNPTSLTVNVSGLFYVYDNAYVNFAATTFDLTSYLPATAFDQKFVILGLNISTNALTVKESATTNYPTLTADNKTIPFSASDVEAITYDSDFMPSTAIRLREGQTTIEKWDIFKDCRLWLVSGSTGGNVLDTILTDNNGDVLSDNNGNVLYGSVA